MNTRTFLGAAALCLVAGPLLAHADTKAKPAVSGDKPKAAATTAQPPMDAKAMEEMMMKAAAPGPRHELLKKLAGEWNTTVSWTMDPSQPQQETKSTSVVTTLMEGRFCQEQASGEMMGRPFTGMGITGYDNVLQKYVGTWIDNFGTGIMTSEGVPDETGKVINWTWQYPDPMTGKVSKGRMVTRFLDDNKRTFEMFGAGPDGKEMKMMTITYERKM